MFFFREKCRLTSFIFVDQPNRGLTLTWFFPLPTDNLILTCQKYASSKNWDHQWSVTRGQDIQKSLGYVSFLRVHDPEKLIPAGLQITPEKWLSIPSKELRFGPGEAENVPGSIWAPFVNSYQALSPQKLTSYQTQLSPFISSIHYLCFHRDSPRHAQHVVTHHHLKKPDSWDDPRSPNPRGRWENCHWTSSANRSLASRGLPRGIKTLRFAVFTGASFMARSPKYLKEQRFMAWSCDSRTEKNWRLFWDNSPY